MSHHEILNEIENRFKGKFGHDYLTIGSSAPPEGGQDRYPDFDASLANAMRSASGVTVPWTLIVSIGLGLWLMFIG